MPVFTTDPLDLLVSLTVTSDCQIIDIPPVASSTVKRHLSSKHRIVRIGDHLTPDRSSLRDVIAQLPEDAQVEVEYELATASPPRVNIARSVEINGKVCNLTERDGKEAMLKLLNEEQEPASESKVKDTLARVQVPSSSQSHVEEDSAYLGDTTRFTSTSMATFDKFDEDHHGHRVDTIRTKFEKAVIKVQPGRCIIAICTDVNPISEIELLASMTQKKVFAVDCGLKVRNRPKPSQIAAAFVEAIRNGCWFVVLHANKSIGTLQLLDNLFKELHDKKLEGVHEESRVFICMEQHPHFPRLLSENAVIMKLTTSFEGSSLMSDTFSSASSCTRLVTGQKKADAVSDSRKVRIAAAVDIVDIEARDIISERPSAQPIDVSGSVVLQNGFSGLMNDKFLCVAPAGDNDRFAVGSSLGNVYFLDSMGCSLLQVHAHDASIWDLAFREKYRFTTGSEDGTSVEWSCSNEKGDAQASLQCNARHTLGTDVYCVRYLHPNDPHTPLLTGGLYNSLMVRGRDGTKSYIRTQCSIQVIKSLPESPTAVVGGGDGSISLFDIGTNTLMKTLSDHQRKVPTITVQDNNHFFSGSFDSTIRAWDCRAPGAVNTLTLKLKNYVTGLDVNDNHLAACVGENLYLWDVRKLNEVLGGFPQGWKGLSRGLCVQSASNLVVTASPDGYVRFWRFV